MATESSSTCRRSNKSFQTPFPIEDSLLLPDLLPEIIVEILSRLPVKSLLRFRCVSKSWRSLISQPKFAKTHLSLASGNTDYANHRLILSLNWHSRLQFFEQYPLTDVRSCSFNSILNEQFVTAVELDCPLKVPYRPVSILGCCDGLVCITYGRELCLWNPSTRKSKRLPNVELPVHYIGRYGFGYDESIDDYKVVGFFRDFGDSASEVEVKVYALRSDSWRRIGGFPFCLPLDGLVTCLNGIFVSGALHWFSGGNCGRIIVSLDLVNETYGEVLEPDYRHGRLYEILLDVINGCLTVLATYCDCTELWLMKEYGVIESWTKLVVIPYVEHPVDGQYPRPLCILKNGEFVLLMLSELVLYNPKNGTFKYPRIRNCSLCFTVYTYIESLVSLDIDADSGV